MFLLFSKVYEKIDYNSEITFDLLFIIIAFMVAFLLKKVFDKKEFDLSKFIERNLPAFIFITSVLFAIAHINVVDKTNSIHLYLVLLLPYFFIGYILSYARLSMGFFYAFLCHALNNLFLSPLRKLTKLKNLLLAIFSLCSIS